jgi:hypothetical protein
MHRLILPAAFVLLLSACSTYQYMTVDSTQLKKNDHSQLTFENDTLRLTWRLEGKGGAVTLNINNKTDQPLYVNWKKSAFIRNGQATSLFDNNVMIQGNSTAVAYRTGRAAVAAGRTTVAQGSFTASLSLPEGVDFIPPASSLSRQLPDLERTGQLETYLSDSLKEKKMIATDDMSYSRYRQASFDETQSPVRFSSYITFSFGNNNAQEFAETSSFYIGEIWQTSSAPESFTLYRQQGDQFYITTSSNTR